MRSTPLIIGITTAKVSVDRGYGVDHASRMFPTTMNITRHQMTGASVAATYHDVVWRCWTLIDAERSDDRQMRRHSQLRLI
jgi:hypothetical protein